MTTQKFADPQIDDSEKGELNKRLETIGWALFLIMLGGLGFVPNAIVPEGSWLIGVGLIMLGLNLTRYLYGIRMSSGTILLGTLALIAGVGDFLGLDLPIFAIILILIGLSELIDTPFKHCTIYRRQNKWRLCNVYVSSL